MRLLLKKVAALANVIRKGPARPPDKPPANEAPPGPKRKAPGSRLDFSSLPDIKNEMQLVENARALAEQIRIPGPVFSYLYSKSHWQTLSPEAWIHEARTAFAIHLILSVHFGRNDPGNFADFIDGADQLRALPSGTLLLTFHGAFVRLARGLFGDTFPTAVQLDRAITKDAGGALFSALRSLQEGHHVLVAPDGPGGKKSAQIRVFDKDVAVAEGAAFLAHTSGCPTAWYTILRNGERFAVHIEPGPRREADESYRDFQRRLLDFYGSKIEALFSGDPKNVSIFPVWRSAFRPAHPPDLDPGDSKKQAKPRWTE